MREVPDKVALAIGIFCMENFPYKSIQMIVEDHAGTKLHATKKMEIGKGKFTVITERGKSVALPLKVTHKYEQPGCHVCLDYVANLGDISTGSVGSPDGWTTVFIRTKKGEEIWNKAIASGCFETKPIEQVKPGLELAERVPQLASRVAWLGGIPRAQLSTLWPRLDCLVAPSRTTAGWVETYPVQVLEAMGHGVTVVVSDSGALPEVVGKAGMTFQDGHPLTEALTRLLESGELRERLAAEGRRRVIAEYVDDAIARKTLAFWRAVRERARG